MPASGMAPALISRLDVSLSMLLNSGKLLLILVLALIRLIASLRDISRSAVIRPFSSTFLSSLASN